MSGRTKNARHLTALNLATLVPHLIHDHHRPAHRCKARRVLMKCIIRKPRKQSLLPRAHIIPLCRQLNPKMIRHLLYVIERLARVCITNIIEFIK